LINFGLEHKQTFKLNFRSPDITTP